jgi:hypothetical protein
MVNDELGSLTGVDRRVNGRERRQQCRCDPRDVSRSTWSMPVHISQNKAKYDCQTSIAHVVSSSMSGGAYVGLSLLASDHKSSSNIVYLANFLRKKAQTTCACGTPAGLAVSKAGTTQLKSTGLLDQLQVQGRDGKYPGVI